MEVWGGGVSVTILFHQLVFKNRFKSCKISMNCYHSNIIIIVIIIIIIIIINFCLWKSAREGEKALAVT